MLPVLRPHQAIDFQKLSDECAAGRDPLLVAPCGYGKGTLISLVVNQCVERGHNVIFAVHGISLVQDMSERVAKLGIEHGVLMGGRKRQRWHPVQVASIDTLHRMSHPPSASLIIIDEAHMAMSPKWRETLARYPYARKIGATATPIRLDGKGLGKVQLDKEGRRVSGGLFDTMILGPSEQELIDLGYLVPSRVLAPPPPAKLNDIRRKKGDVDEKAGAEICNTSAILGNCVEHWKKYAMDKKTAAFGFDRNHANAICDRFKAEGFQWAYVDANTPVGDPKAPEQGTRAAIWRDLDDPNSGLRGVSSVGCISVGWDHPIVECLIFERFTTSLQLWKQMLGRGSRPYPGKTHFLVLDHVGNTHEHEPYGMFEDTPPWSLDGTVKGSKEEPKSRQYATCKNAYLWPDKRHEPPTIINGAQLPCYATFAVGPKECPFCGLPQKAKGREIVVEKGELQEITRPRTIEERRIAAQNEAIFRGRFEELVEEAEEKGYRKGWAFNEFGRRYGFAPSMNWVRQAVELRDAMNG